jgi:hypothetical protein
MEAEPAEKASNKLSNSQTLQIFAEGRENLLPTGRMPVFDNEDSRKKIFHIVGVLILLILLLPGLVIGIALSQDLILVG